VLLQTASHARLGARLPGHQPRKPLPGGASPERQSRPGTTIRWAVARRYGLRLCVHYQCAVLLDGNEEVHLLPALETGQAKRGFRRARMGS
jgi:hypothetical protein